MDNNACSRATARLHWITVLLTLFVAAVLLVANLDGYHNQLFGEGDLAAEPPLINWAHGWPWTFMVRSSIYPLSGVYTPTGFIGPHGVTSRWPVDDAPVIVLWGRQLVFDSLSFLVLVSGTAYAAQRMARRWNARNSYGLRTLFFATSVVAIAICFGPALFADDRRNTLNFAILSVAGVTTVLAVLSFFDVAVRIFVRWGHSRPAA